MANAGAQMVVYPWIKLDAPVTVAGVEFLPRSAAIARAGEIAANVAAGTSYLRDHYLDGSPFKGDPPPSLRALEPTVVLLDEQTTIEQVELANLIWFMAVLFANDLQFKYSNATTFAHFYQRLGGDPSTHARRTRRMHGHKLGGSMVQLVIDVRPQWCGNYHDPDSELQALLEHVLTTGNAEHIQRCIEALMSATADSDTEPADAEHANFARAVERLLHRPVQTRQSRNGDQHALGEKLLGAVVPSHSGPWQIMEVRDAMRDQRNVFWHAEDRKNATRSFEMQTAVRPNLIAFHATTALVIASAQEILGQSVPINLQDYVRAVEEWIAEIEENDPRPSEEASDLRGVWVSAISGSIRTRIPSAAGHAGGNGSAIATLRTPDVPM